MSAITDLTRSLLTMSTVLAGVILLSADVEAQVLSESVKLLAPDGAANDEFGQAVSLEGDIAVVGVRRDDDFGADSGSAHVYRRLGLSWLEQQKLLPSSGEADDEFGVAVAVHDDVIVIGASGDNQAGEDSGAVYIFRWNGVTWTQEQKLGPLDADPGDKFGGSVAISGELVVVGADLDDELASGAGAAYVFRWNGVSWLQEQKLLPMDGATFDQFGLSVSISGNTVVVGSPFDDDLGSDCGSAYGFRYDASQTCGQLWCQKQKLLPDNSPSGDNFGSTVAVFDDVVVVGAKGDDDAANNAGAAYAYRWNGVSWDVEQKIFSADASSEDAFGGRVAAGGSHILIAAMGDDDNGVDSGAAYLFAWGGGTWMQEQKLLPSDGLSNDSFGQSVAIVENVAIVSAFLDDDLGTDSGSAFVFHLGPEVPSVSSWGIVSLTLMIGLVATLMLRRVGSTQVR